MSDPVIFIKLALAEPILLDGFGDKTKLLSEAHRFRTNVILGFCDANIKKDQSVSGVFNDVEAMNGQWELEIAIELPDLLPTIEGKSESIIEIKLDNNQLIDLCISNRMSRFHYQDKSGAFHALAPRTQQWHGSVAVTGEDNKELTGIEDQARSMISMSFLIQGEDAENAFESSITSCLDTLFQSTNLMLQAIRESHKNTSTITRFVSKESIGYAYVLMSGSTPSSGARLGLNFARFMKLTQEIDGDNAIHFRELLDGTTNLDDISKFMGEAESSCANADYEYSLLQSVIAAEIATKRSIYAECVRQGVSVNKLKQTQKDMTYSWALNIGLPLVFQRTVRPDTDLINLMNKARKMRNGLMHEASLDIDRASLRELLQSTRKYIEQLKTANAITDRQLQEGGAGI